MRPATLLACALVAAPAVVSAAGSLGFAIGNKKADGTCKVQSDYESDFDTIGTQAKLVRTYSSSDCNTAQEILPACKSKGFQVILGVWPDTDDSFNLDKNALKANVPQFKSQVYAITVGSETLYRGNFTGAELESKISSVKSIFPDIKVGTADSWNKYADGTADPVIKSADIILCNAFSYWQGQDIKNATADFFDDIMQALAKVQSTSGSTGGIEFWVGETGWPTKGTAYESAQPGTDNAKTYYHSAVCGITAWGVNTFVFEAFDEPWKPVSIGQNGEVADETHWGVWNADRSSKYDLSC